MLDRSRRVALVDARASPFGSVVTGSFQDASQLQIENLPLQIANCQSTSHGVAISRAPTAFQLAICNGQFSICNPHSRLRAHRYKPTFWWTITCPAPRCVKVPNLLAAVNAQRR